MQWDGDSIRSSTSGDWHLACGIISLNVNCLMGIVSRTVLTRRVVQPTFQASRGYRYKRRAGVDGPI
ncbi:hypothetical protein BJX62DRAFT_179619 [Aspergillus germanicus]